jgi:hypothetical protein
MYQRGNRGGAVVIYIGLALIGGLPVSLMYLGYVDAKKRTLAKRSALTDIATWRR